MFADLLVNGWYWRSIITFILHFYSVMYYADLIYILENCFFLSRRYVKEKKDNVCFHLWVFYGSKTWLKLCHTFIHNDQCYCHVIMSFCDIWNKMQLCDPKRKNKLKYISHMWKYVFQISTTVSMRLHVNSRIYIYY